MTVALLDTFESYVKKSNNIFDIMVAAYKIICPFESNVSLGQDADLVGMVLRYSEQYNMVQALIDMKKELIEWIHRHEDTDIGEIKKKLFCLVRLIDAKCVKAGTSSLPDSYIQYFALNDLFQDEIIIVPRSEGSAVRLLSEAMSEKEGHGFYARNYSSTKDASGYLKNFIIYKTALIKPRINIPNYYDEITREFEQNKHKLKVGIFPLTNINLNSIFLIKEDIVGKDGLFRIESSVSEQENQLLERCKEALKICRNYCVDIAVFPEMLFTKKIQDAIIEFVRNNEEEGNRFPWFTWLGTVWAERENKCMVIDQYGKVVFEQKKYVPYEYQREDGLKIREDLAHEKDWVVNYIDIPGLFRIATAICRDISDDLLKGAVKQLYSDMMVIPAFSRADRLTKRDIEPLVLERIITVVCNACSARCGESQERFEVTQQMTGGVQPFCYLSMPAKRSQDNAPDYHKARYTSACMECEKYCKGFVWEISFSQCTVKNDCYSAKVTCLNA